MASLSVIQTQTPPGMIDLGRGDPSLSLLPLEMMRAAAEIRFAGEDPSFLQYGSGQGDGYFRLALAEFLGKRYRFPVESDRLFVTNGISNALDQICTLFTQSGDTIFVEEPSYFLAFQIFKDHHLRVVSIQTDEDGLVIESLEEMLARFQPRFLYLIPTFQNPTGMTLSQKRREQVVHLAQERNFLVIADEVYHFLNYADISPRPFAIHTDIENIISLGSFSKILAPGLRLGWIQAHPQKIAQLVNCGLLDSGGGLNPFTSAIVRGVVESGDLEVNIHKLIQIYRERVKTMDSALKQNLPEVKYKVPQGGYFFWAKLPDQMDAEVFQKNAESFKVDFRPGVRFSSQGGLSDYIRLCYVHYEPDEIEQGILRLKQCLDGGG
ncbi:MAG: PLP-dependent aminotransferase family protein [Chloroflexi bacterium]|nr:PLP-dependent aminotransferase family protein [Chloroflexota bacterium]